MRSSNFDWDDANVEHIDAHRVTPGEVEQAFDDPDRVPADAYNVATERRYAFVGTSGEGRLLRVVYTERRGMIRVISAFDANARDARRYDRRRR